MGSYLNGELINEKEVLKRRKEKEDYLKKMMDKIDDAKKKRSLQ